MWKRSKHVPFPPVTLLLGRRVLFCFLFCAALPPAPAQTLRSDAAPPTPPTLASALAASSPAPEGLTLVIGADKTGLPKGAVLPLAPARLGDIASAFGCRTQTFGGVTALAPATMIVLNADPATPNVAADIAPYQAIKLLAATLDDAQWHALTSDTGLGLRDLTDDSQRGLFHALFRDGQLWVASDDPELRKLPEDKRTDIQNLTDNIDGVHLRMGQTAQIYIHDKAGKTVFFSDSSPDKTPGLTIYRPKRDAPAATHGVVLRAVVPNTPKPGDLNFAAPMLQTPISLTGVHTVGELTTCIGLAAHTELYADPHYAARTVTILGHAATAPAADLLRALCLCVCGTVRRVGPAFVLTDDLVGVGVRRQILSDWDKKADALESDMTDAAGRAILASHGKEVRTVPSFGDPMALTPDQIKAEKLSDDIPEVPGFDDNTVSFSQLTPLQQDVAKRIATDYNDKRASSSLPDYLENDHHAAADLNPQVSLNPQVYLEMLIPTLSVPVAPGFGKNDMMFFVWPGVDALYANSAKARKAKPAVPEKPAPPLAPLLRMGTRRALIAHPRNAADVDAVLAVMQKLGLNELYLDVFSDGVARVAGTPLSPSTPFVGPDILTEAITRGKTDGIAVYADMNLLTWGDQPPAALADPNILGENTNEAAVRRHSFARDDERDDDGNPLPFTPPGVDVNPVAARDTLLAVVSTIASVPGLAGFVWKGTIPDSDVGYTPAMRLAFLRARHADPLDIDSVERYELPNGTNLPQWDNRSVDSSLRDQWTQFRDASNLETLRVLRRAATLAHPALPVLMEQSESSTNWYASWDNAAAAPPPLRDLFPNSRFPDRDQIAAAARLQGHIVLLDINVKGSADTDILAYRLAYASPAVHSIGFVLDFDDEDATRGPHSLDTLLQEVKSPAAL